MSKTNPATILIITPADFDAMSNDRDRMQWYVPPGGRLVFVYKVINRAGGVAAMLRDACTFSIRRRVEGGLELIAVDPLLAELRREQTGRPAHVVPHGVEWDRYARARTTTRREPGLIYIGNVISWCGIEHAIDAMPAIRRAVPGARLLVVGDGQPAYMEHVRALIADADLNGCVELLGRRPPEEVPDLMARVMIGLANSEPVAFRRYAFPIKVVEYMAAGLAVIGTEGTETARIVDECGCGVVIPYDSAGLARAAVDLFQNDARYRTMRDRGIRTSADMSWSRLVAREMTLIREAYARCFASVAP